MAETFSRRPELWHKHFSYKRQDFIAPSNYTSLR